MSVFSTHSIDLFHLKLSHCNNGHCHFIKLMIMLSYNLYNIKLKR